MVAGTGQPLSGPVSICTMHCLLISCPVNCTTSTIFFIILLYYKILKCLNAVLTRRLLEHSHGKMQQQTEQHDHNHCVSVNINTQSCSITKTISANSTVTGGVLTVCHILLSQAGLHTVFNCLHWSTLFYCRLLHMQTLCSKFC